MSMGSEIEAMLQDMRDSMPEYNFGAYRPPGGEKHPEKYPYVGPHYQGEVPNYIYDSARDRYTQDPKYIKDFNREHGFKNPNYIYEKPPSFLEQLLPVLGATGSSALISSLIKDPSGFMDGWGDVLGLGKSSGAGDILSGGSEGLGGLDLGSDGLGSLDFGSLFSNGEGGDALSTLRGVKDKYDLVSKISGEGEGGGLSDLFSGGGGLGGAEGAFASYGIPVAAAAGAYLSGKSILDGFQGKKDHSAAGTYGRGQAAFSSGGASELAPFLGGLFGHKSTHDYQDERDSALSAKDPSYASFINTVKANRGNIPDSKYNLSHDLNDLGVNDITGSQSFFEHDPEWMKKTEAERNRIAQSAIDAHALSSNHGMIDVDFNKFNPNATSTNPLDSLTTASNPNDVAKTLQDTFQQGKDPSQALHGSGLSHDDLQQMLLSGQIDPAQKDMFLKAINGNWEFA